MGLRFVLAGLTTHLKHASTQYNSSELPTPQLSSMVILTVRHVLPGIGSVRGAGASPVGTSAAACSTLDRLPSRHPVGCHSSLSARSLIRTSINAAVVGVTFFRLDSAVTAALNSTLFTVPVSTSA